MLILFLAQYWRSIHHINKNQVFGRKSVKFFTFLIPQQDS